MTNTDANTLARDVIESLASVLKIADKQSWYKVAVTTQIPKYASDHTDFDSF